MEEMKITYPKVKLRFNDLLTTAVRYKEKTKAGLILAGEGHGTRTKAPMMSTQIVVAAGESSSYNVGDVVEVNIDSFPRKPKKNQHDLGDAGYETVPPVEFIDDEMYFMLTDRQLKYSYEDRELEGEELLNFIRENKSYV